MNELDQFVSLELSYSTADLEKTVFYGLEHSLPDESAPTENSADKTVVLVVHGDMYVLENRSPDAIPLTKNSGLFRLPKFE